MKGEFTKDEVAEAGEGFGASNVKIFLGTPEGVIFSSTGGFRSPEFLLGFLRYEKPRGGDLRKALQDAAAAVLERGC